MDHTGALVVGRYALYGEIASGGMATVHFGRQLGPAGFSRTVAIKRLHPGLAKEQEFVSMFFDEVRLAARIQHPNVVATLDAVEENGELFLVMEYVHGESLAQLVRLARARGILIPPRIAATIVCGLLHGLHAAHEAIGKNGEPLRIIHRDVSPQNVMVGTDGVTRVLDFGIARAAGRLQTTREGQLKGKIAYLAPERARGQDADRRSDVYGAAVVLWEALTGAPLFDGDNDASVLARVISAEVAAPSALAPDIPTYLDAITLRGLEREPDERFESAREMAMELQEHVSLVPATEVGDWVAAIAAQPLAIRARYLAELDRFGGMRGGPNQPRVEPARTAGEGASTRRVNAPVPNTSEAPDALASVQTAEGSEIVGPSHKPAGPAGPPQRKRLRLATSAAVGVLAVTATVYLGMGRLSARSVIPATSPAASSPPQRELSPLSEQGETSPIPSTPGTPPEEADASHAAVTTVRTPAKAAPTPVRRSKQTPSPKPNSPTPAAQSPVSDPEAPAAEPAEGPCHPPYTVDAAGFRHYKVDCVVDGRR